MCSYCGCDRNDPVPGMRVGSFVDDPADHQGEISYSWTGYPVIGNGDFMNPTPPVGEQIRQQRLSGRGPAVGVDSR
jgi:hypothetical protein